MAAPASSVTNSTSGAESVKLKETMIIILRKKKSVTQHWARSCEIFFFLHFTICSKQSGRLRGKKQRKTNKKWEKVEETTDAFRKGAQRIGGLYVNMIGWAQSAVLLMFHFTWNIIHGSRSGASRDQFQSVTRGGRSQTENKGAGLDCNAFSRSPSLPPPPSTCLCAGPLLISEALSFVSVRCPKDCGMKRDT